MDERRRNPKHMQREAQKAVQNTGFGKKAQQALKFQQKQGKLELRVRSKEPRRTDERGQFEIRPTKCREKRGGHLTAPRVFCVILYFIPAAHLLICRIRPW